LAAGDENKFVDIGSAMDFLARIFIVLKRGMPF
jgi:hypothetical protein